MAYTRANAEVLIRSVLDDPSGVRWTDTELRLFADSAFDSLWARLLTDRPKYNSAFQNLTSLTSPGYLDTADGGGLTLRFVKLQSLTRNAQQYGELDPANVIIEDGAVVSAEDHGYIFLGDHLHLFPYNTTDDVEIRHSYRPAVWSTISAGNITWPMGHEMVYILRIAGLMLLKGGYERQAALDTLGMAEDEYSKMLGALKRTPGPDVMHLTDDSSEWGQG